MVQVLDTSACDMVGLSEALTTTMLFTKVRLKPGGIAIPNRPTLWPTDVPEVFPYHQAGQIALTPPIDVHFVRNGVVGGPGAALRSGEAYLFNAACFPKYIHVYITDGLRPLSWQFVPQTIRSVKGACFHIFHFNPMYGHWLLEIFPKLFAIRQLKTLGIHAPIVVPTNAPQYAIDAVALCLPGQELLFYDPATECLQIERVILPPMLHVDYVFDPDFVAAVSAFATRFLPSQPFPPAVFVSRSAIADKFRRVRNAAELDEVARRLGMAVIRPEALSWTEQVGIFAGVRVIVGEYGSGMHNAIFSGPSTRVICLNVLGKIQSRIGNSLQQDIGYMLDPDGQPRRFTQGWTDQQAYYIDPAEFEAKVSAVLSTIA